MSPRLVLVANARMPSHRAQSLQVAQMACALARAGADTTLLHAERHPTPPLPPGQDLWDFYAVPEGARAAIEAVPCTDWIDRVPRRLQFWPARVQELSFARNAAARAAELVGQGGSDGTGGWVQWDIWGDAYRVTKKKNVES